ncbi:MAG: DUF2760 domain-containing protein [Myxococcales bacterium]|nr:DUF2760 domain-containing protein [Myxococcales bacterium]
MRIALAFRAFFATLWGRPLPNTVHLSPGDHNPLTSEPVPDLIDEPSPLFAEAVATQTLGLLQAEGRLLDFLSEDISTYSDAEVGQVVREIHRGCKKAIDDHFDLEPVRSEAEDGPITIGADFNPHEIRLVGRVVGQPPVTGTLKHAGYRAVSVRLPRIRTDASSRVIAPAEVEL